MKHFIPRKLYTSFKNFLFPPQCVSCKEYNQVFCDKCLFSIPLSSFLENDIHAVFSYNTPAIRGAIHALKYKNNTDIAKRLAIPLHDKIIQELSYQKMFSGFTKPLLIPIPLHKKRQKQRGYNQTKLLCDELSFIDSVFYRTEYNVLYKNKETSSQVKILNRQNRLKNIKNSLSIKNTEKIHGKNIILIDDIVTTGATLKEATKVLKQAGAKKVICFVVAH